MENEKILMEPIVININSLCRLCANQNDNLIGIYSAEGSANDLAYKMNLYFPFKVSQNDQLPLQCCINCINTLLAWHKLVVTSVEVDQKFQSCQFLDEKATDNEVGQVGCRPHPSVSLSGFCQTSDGRKSKRQSNMNKQNPEETMNSPSQSLATFDYITEISQQIINNQTENICKPENDEDNKDFMNMEENEIEANFNNYINSDEDDPDPLGIDNKNCFTCDICPATFLLEKDYNSHIEKDHSNSKVKLEEETDKQQKTNQQKRKHSKLDQEMANKAKVVVDGRIYYNCKECGKSLHSPYTYVWHMRIHTGERPYICDLCGKQFRVSQGLVRHLRETHEGIKKFPCDLCGRMFATRRNVEEHRRIHTNERPYICDLCGKSFKQKASLFVHKRSHRNYFPFKCSYCNQGFRTKPPLLIHITRHTGEKPYKCDICGRCFRIKYELKRHRLIHSDEKPFSCSVCGLGFRQKRYLRNHMKSNHSLIIDT